MLFIPTNQLDHFSCFSAGFYSNLKRNNMQCRKCCLLTYISLHFDTHWTTAYKQPKLISCKHPCQSDVHPKWREKWMRLRIFYKANEYSLLLSLSLSAAANRAFLKIYFILNRESACETFLPLSSVSHSWMCPLAAVFLGTHMLQRDLQLSHRDPCRLSCLFFLCSTPVQPRSSVLFVAICIPRLRASRFLLFTHAKESRARRSVPEGRFAIGKLIYLSAITGRQASRRSPVISNFNHQPPIARWLWA